MGKYHCTIDLLFDWFGVSCMTTDNFCYHLQNRSIQTGQTGGHWYSDTFPFSIPWTEKWPIPPAQAAGNSCVSGHCKYNNLNEIKTPPSLATTLLQIKLECL
jgi:hypothetical protein